MSVQILQDKKNLFLGRREINCVFKAKAGLIKREEAAKIVVDKFNVDVKNVHVISLHTKTGTRDIVGLFYIYDNEYEAKKQLSKHIFLRKVPKKKVEKPTKSEKK